MERGKGKGMFWAPLKSTSHFAISRRKASETVAFNLRIPRGAVGVGAVGGEGGEEEGRGRERRKSYME